MEHFIVQDFFANFQTQLILIQNMILWFQNFKNPNLKWINECYLQNTIIDEHSNSKSKKTQSNSTYLMKSRNEHLDLLANGIDRNRSQSIGIKLLFWIHSWYALKFDNLKLFHFISLSFQTLWQYATSLINLILKIDSSPIIKTLLSMKWDLLHITNKSFYQFNSKQSSKQMFFDANQFQTLRYFDLNEFHLSSFD